MRSQHELRRATRKLRVLSGVFAIVVSAGLISTIPRSVAQDAGPNSKANSAGSGNVENGRKLYTAEKCWECHNDEAQGGNAPRIGPTNLSLAALTAYIRHPKGQMPPYIDKVVSDAEIADIYAYLQSKPKAPAAKTIPLLNY